MDTTSLKQKISLIVFGLFLCFFFLEIGLRICGFMFLSLQEHRNHSSLKQKDTYRILCLGESTTAGTWPNYLEDYLNQASASLRFSVIDKGIPGVSSGTLVSMLEDNLDKYNPQMVITMMGINDMDTVAANYGIPDTTTTPFLKSLRIYKIVKMLYTRIVPKIDSPNLCGQSNKAQTQETLQEREKLLKRNLESDSQNERGYIAIGDYYRITGADSKAENMYKKAIKINPSNEHPYLALGNYYVDIRQHDRAVKMFKEVLRINPKEPDAYLGLGRCYQESGLLNEAEYNFKKAIELKPKGELLYSVLGQYYIVIGCFDKAEECFIKAVEVNPKNEHCSLELVGYYKQTGQNDKAKELLEKAIKINPESIRLNAALAAANRETGKNNSVQVYPAKAKSLEIEHYGSVTCYNYLRLKGIIEKRGLALVCVQYPMRSMAPLKRVFQDKRNILFVDNEKLFKKRVAQEGYDEYFTDIFAGDFGHCTKKGYKLLAENIGDIILKEYF